jgi:ABC-type transport system involved in cytochrome bd biosynthesis fused ATPase/permease subunit
MARSIGATQSVALLGLAVVTGVALARLAHRDVVGGVGVLAVALFARWLVGVAVEEWGDTAARRVREAWRARLFTHFEKPTREGERSRADLALAIEHAAGAPSLEALRAAAAVSLAGVVVVFVAAGALSAGVVVALLLVAAPLYRRAGRRSSLLEEEYERRRAQLESRQLELLHRSPELRALGAVHYGADAIAAISDSEHTLAMRAIRVALGSSLVTEFLSGVSVGLVAMVVGFDLLGGRTSLVRALVAVLVTAELFTLVRRYGAEFHRRERTTRAAALLVSPVAFDRLDDPTTLVLAEGLITEAGADPVSLRVAPGTRTLVTGPSGSGKTTLLHTLVGWRAPRSGTLTRFAGRVSFVSAESTLLSGTLWENLTLGAELAPGEVRRLLDDLGLTGPRFADLASPVLADGRGLSGGEVVRLAIARGLLAQPSLLILDDVAGVLDEASRARVTDVLAARRDLAVVEATVDTPLIDEPTALVRIEP